MATKKKVRKKVAEKARGGYRLQGKLVKEFPRSPGRSPKPGMHPRTKSMVEKIRQLMGGQIFEFELSSRKEAKVRRDALARLRKKKRLTFKQAIQSGTRIYVKK